MRYRLQRHDGTDCSATMVPITVLRMVPIQRYRQLKNPTRQKITINIYIIYQYTPYSNVSKIYFMQRFTPINQEIFPNLCSRIPQNILIFLENLYKKNPFIHVVFK